MIKSLEIFQGFFLDIYIPNFAKIVILSEQYISCPSDALLSMIILQKECYHTE